MGLGLVVLQSGYRTSMIIIIIIILLLLLLLPSSAVSPPHLLSRLPPFRDTLTLPCDGKALIEHSSRTPLLTSASKHSRRARSAKRLSQVSSYIY